MNKTPKGAADARLLHIALHIDGRTECGHGVKWADDCPECASVWREDRVKELEKQAAKYGFRLVPL
jgi:hypothetical protein